MNREVTPATHVDPDDVAYAPTIRVAPDWDPLEPGDSFGSYQVISKLGEGGASIVYLAEESALERRVALKLLRGKSEKSKLRVLREARAMARLCHPNVVTVHSVGAIDNHVYLAMEYIEGGTLRDWLFERKRSWREIVEVMLSAGRGLAAAHRAGLVHRDFKPDNVLVGNNGRVCVTDFGLVVPAEEDLLEQSSRTRDLYSDRLTNTGALVGTPAYMSPEQHAEKSVGPASDQFSFCVALYEALYEELPFEGGTDLAMAYNAVHGHLRNPPADPAPVRVRRALRRGLNPNPDRRYASMEQLLAQLERALAARRRRLALGTGGLVLAALIAQGLHSPEPPPTSPFVGPVCELDDGQMAGVWDDDRRQQLRAAFERYGSSAMASHHLVVEWLDCLESTRRGIRALSSLLIDGSFDPPSAVHAVSQLELASDCASVTSSVPLLRDVDDPLYPDQHLLRAGIERCDRQRKEAHL